MNKETFQRAKVLDLEIDCIIKDIEDCQILMNDAIKGGDTGIKIGVHGLPSIMLSQNIAIDALNLVRNGLTAQKAALEQEFNNL
jgi:hypothetical protein